MFIEKFKFENYIELMKLLNLKDSSCEYKVEGDRVIIGSKTNITVDKINNKMINKPETIYAFYDFDVKTYKLKFLQEENEINYVNEITDPVLKNKYIKFMKKTFQAEYEKALKNRDNLEK